jgi:ribose transport system ATP-binding protein
MTETAFAHHHSEPVEPSAEPILLVESLSKTFPGTKALDQLGLEVQRGEVHALVGQNGSGKSTLIKVLAGFHQPDPGASAVVEGQGFQLGDATAAHRAGLRFVHQDLGLVLGESAIDNIALGFGYKRAKLGRIDWPYERRKAKESLEALGYHIDVRIPVNRLSAMQRTAVAVVRALQDWEEAGTLLVLDEPTATMPASEVDRLFELVQTLRTRGMSVLYVSHHLQEVFEIADRVTVLRDGRRVTTTDVGSVTTADLVEMMTGGLKDDARPRRSAVTDQEILRVMHLRGREVRQLDVTVHAGEIVGVAGVDGSGRDEVNRLIFGGASRKGDVWVDGKSVRPTAPHLSVEAGMGFVPGNRHVDGLVLEMDLLENLTLADLGAYWGRMIFHKDRERSDVQEWMERLRIVAPDEKTSVQALSGGNQQKVVIGRWLKLEPRVLLLDEPTQGVDVGGKAEVHRLVASAAEMGTAVLCCSSDEEELAHLCHRVLVMRHGTIVAELSGPDLTVSRIVEECMGSSYAGPDGGQPTVLSGE